MPSTLLAASQKDGKEYLQRRGHSDEKFIISTPRSIAKGWYSPANVEATEKFRALPPLGQYSVLVEASQCNDGPLPGDLDDLLWASVEAKKAAGEI